MDDSIQQDLLSAHADALTAKEGDYHRRYTALFPTEMSDLSALFGLAEQLYELLRQPAPMRPAFRTDLKAGLLAAAHQQQATRPYPTWRWAALGASAVTVGMLAAAAWRGSHARQ